MLTYRHDDTRKAHIRTEPLSHTRSLPKGRNKVVVLVAVYDTGREGVCVCRGTYCEEDDEKKRLEVEECCLGGGKLIGLERL